MSVLEGFSEELETGICCECGEVCYVKIVDNGHDELHILEKSSSCCGADVLDPEEYRGNDDEE